jgi:hypothetical protein
MGTVEASRVELVAVTGKFNTDVKASAGVYSNAMRQIGAGGAPAAAGAKSVEKAHDSLLGKFREFRQEQVQQGRMAKFYARELVEMVPAAEGAKSAIQGVLGVMVEGAAGGLSFGLAFEAAKLAVGALAHAWEASKKMAADAKKQYEESLQAVVSNAQAAADAIQEIYDKSQQLQASAIAKRQADAAREALNRRKAALERADEDAARPRAGESVNTWSKRKEAYKTEREEMVKGIKGWTFEVSRLEEKAQTQADAEKVEQARDHGQRMLSLEAEYAQGRLKLIKEFELDKLRIEGRAGISEEQAAKEVAARRKILNKALKDSEIEEAVRQEELAGANTGYEADPEEEARVKADQKKRADAAIEEAVRQEELAGANTGYEDDGGQGAQVAEQQKKRLEEMQKRGKEVTRVAEEIGSTFGDAFAGMITGTKSVSQAFSQMGAEMLKVIMKVAIESITASAGKAAGEAASSQAGIPIVGPALAAGAMAAMFGMVIGLIGKIGSASQGAVIGRGQSPLVRMHEEEWALPSRYAKPLGRLLENGGSLGGGQPTIVNLHVSAWDGEHALQTLTRQRDMLLRVLSGNRMQVGRAT